MEDRVGGETSIPPDGGDTVETLRTNQKAPPIKSHHPTASLSSRWKLCSYLLTGTNGFVAIYRKVIFDVPELDDNIVTETVSVMSEELDEVDLLSKPVILSLDFIVSCKL